MDFIIVNEPIVVVVGNGRYDMYGHVPPTPHDLWLGQILKGMGGVNETVADGKYHFSAEELVPGKIVATLEPVQE
jgi:hypothetical protein